MTWPEAVVLVGICWMIGVVAIVANWPKGRR